MGWVGSESCWVGLGDVKWTNVHLWSRHLKKFTSIKQALNQSTASCHTAIYSRAHVNKLVHILMGHWWRLNGGGHIIFVSNQPPRPTQPGYPFRQVQCIMSNKYTISCSMCIERLEKNTRILSNFITWTNFSFFDEVYYILLINYQPRMVIFTVNCNFDSKNKLLNAPFLCSQHA